MNKMRRSEIKKIMQLFKEQDQKLEDILNEEQEYYDNMPENLQESQRALDSDEAIDNITAAIMNLRDVIRLLDDISY